MSSASAPPRFNPLEHPIALMMPEHLSPISSWVQHIPFAFVLIELLRPRLFVELGTSHGDSYCAFCQALVTQHIAARCFAIDTWAGDEQEGFYSKDVLKALRAHHDPRYGSFSQLLETHFDSARPQFADGTIDLLHIDGLHTYEAVRHDFESWLPKLSDRAVVLFHDTAVRDRADFGVWRFWDEIFPRYPSFSFEHGYGLGIIAVGGQAPQAVLQFMAAANADLPAVREYFATLGHRIEVSRVLRVVAGYLHVQQTILDEWKQELGRPLCTSDHSMRAVSSSPASFARDLTQELQQFAMDELDRRDAQARPA